MRLVFVGLWLSVACRTPANPPAAPVGEVSPAPADRLVTMTGVVRDIQYSIELPPGATSSSSMTNVRWQASAGAFTFDLLIDRAPDLTYEQYAANRAEPPLRSNRTADDAWALFYVAEPAFEGAMRQASVHARVGTLLCEGHLRARTASADIEAGLAQLEAMCTSLTAK